MSLLFADLHGRRSSLSSLHKPSKQCWHVTIYDDSREAWIVSCARLPGPASKQRSQVCEATSLLRLYVGNLGIFRIKLLRTIHLPIIELAMWLARMYVSHVLDRKLLERLMSPSPKSQVMFAPAFSWIGDFFRIFGIHIFQVMASLVNLV